MTYSNDFPVLAATTYLNTASSGILSTRLLNWRHSHDQQFFEAGSGFRLQQAELLDTVRQDLGRFFSTGDASVFLIPNFSHGFNALLNGLQGAQHFLLLGNEYPSVYYPVRSRGYTCTVVEMGSQLEARITDSIVKNKPNVFVFSLVQYSTGLRLSAAFLQSLKQQFPDLLLVADGTQYCGTETLDFSASPLDVLLASGYKWMLGGYGNGFALIKKGTAESLYAAARTRPLPDEIFLQGKSLLAFQFEPGHLDTLAFGSLQQSALMLEQTGLPHIETTVRNLAVKAKAAFTARGLLDDYIAERDIHSSIFRLNISDALIEKIRAANITGTIRGKGLRVSFHFYNDEEDLNRLLKVIDANR